MAWMPRASSHWRSGGTTAARSERLGRAMMPTLCILLGVISEVGCLILRFFASVQKVLLVAFGSGEAAGPEAEDLQACGFGGAAGGFGGGGGEVLFVDR